MQIERNYPSETVTKADLAERAWLQASPQIGWVCFACWRDGIAMARGQIVVHNFQNSLSICACWSLHQVWNLILLLLNLNYPEWPTWSLKWSGSDIWEFQNEFIGKLLPPGPLGAPCLRCSLLEPSVMVQELAALAASHGKHHPRRPAWPCLQMTAARGQHLPAAAWETSRENCLIAPSQPTEPGDIIITHFKLPGFEMACNIATDIWYPTL